MDKKCENGWHTGECCCNCKNLIELFKHPWNKINKGGVTETTEMYACILELSMDDQQRGTIFEFKHGFCEMHEPK